jgi:hypothetical protein
MFSSEAFSTFSLHACETSSLARREEYALTVFENRVLRKIVRPKREKVTWSWKN